MAIFAKLCGLLEKGAFGRTRKQLHKLRSTAKELEGLRLTVQSLVYLDNYLAFSDLRKLIAKIGASLVT